MPPASSSSSEPPGGLPGETLSVRSDADVVVVQSRARAFALMHGATARAAWEVAIAASEAATNIVKYAGRGTVTLRLEPGPPRVLVLEARDSGPGIADAQAARRDGVSEGVDYVAQQLPRTGRGLGLGLGAIERLMDSLDIESPEGGGTLVRARKRIALPRPG